ncbi:hypothetical protein LFL97_24745 [Burkholderia sp. JSH-S8]|nr:hypothetical protein LFL97_24745 [Burkholderia sp. JSH-S8]
MTIKQTKPEPIGSRHAIRVFASSHVTLHNEKHPSDMHDEFKPLGGVQFQVAVLRKTKLTCNASKGLVRGTIAGLDPKDRDTRIYVSGVDARGRFIPGVGRLADVRNGKFVTEAPKEAKRGVCLYAGSLLSTSAGSQIFPID